MQWRRIGGLDDLENIGLPPSLSETAAASMFLSFNTPVAMAQECVFVNSGLPAPYADVLRKICHGELVVEVDA